MTGERERAWVLAAAGVAALATVARLHNAFAYPPLRDFDGPGHALNVFALFEGELPDPRSWSGFHPPLYYAVGAVLWHLLPEAIPVHTALRLLSAAAGLGAVAIAWRSLLRFVPAADAAVVAALAACAPVVAIATSMIGNETTCALFATAALARLLAIPREPARAQRHAFPSGALAGLAALSKSTGLGVVAVVAAAYGWALRRAPRSAAAALAIAGGVGLAIAAPHYAWLLAQRGSPQAVISGGAPAGAAGSEMAAQPPGERHVSDYFFVPAGTLLAPFKDSPGMVRSVPGLLYASTWADAHGQFLPVEVPAVVGAAALGALLGLFPTALAVAGLWQMIRQPRAWAAAAAPMAYAALLLGAFAVQTWVVPRFSAVKASYLLSALLPAMLVLAAGLVRTRGRARGAARGALLGIALYATALTWYGWWT